jgi:hypothetical protein
MHKIKYALFYDFHTSPNHPNVGARFDAEKLTDRFLECGVDYVTFHARCNMGMAYYDTKIGTKHPSLKKDIFGELAFACERKGIALGAYFNGGLSRMEAVTHRDWARVNFDGKIYQEPLDSPFSMTMCYNSPYRDHLIAMAMEVAKQYPIKGFFFDCMSAFPCVCPICVSMMQKRGDDISSLEAVTEFAALSAARLADEISATLRKINPDYLFYFNNIPFESQKTSGNYLEFECLPSKSGGYLYMHTIPRYMRTLDKTCVHMTGRFHRWSDFGGLRNLESLKYELLFALTNGLRPNIGDHLLPDGSVNEVVFELIREIYGELQKYEPYLENSLPVTEVALVCSQEKSRISQDWGILGALRLLIELRVQFDIVSKASSWDKYQLLIFPDHIDFDQEIQERVTRHLAKGKSIIASGSSGLGEKQQFPEEWPVKYLAPANFSPAYFEMNFPGLIENMTLSFYDDAYEVEPDSDAEVLAQLVRPAVNFGWNGIIPEYYNPPYEKTSLPFLTISKQIAYFSGKVFSGYHTKSPQQLRVLIDFVLGRMYPEPILKVRQAPSYLQASVSANEKQMQVSLFACIPEKRGLDTESIEAELPVSGLELAIRINDRTPARVFSAPENKMLEFSVNEKYAYVKVPDFVGFLMLCLEF